MHCALCNGILWRWLICQVGGCPFPVEHLCMKRKQIFKLFSGLQTTFWQKLGHISLLRRRCLKQNRIIDVMPGTCHWLGQLHWAQNVVSSLKCVRPVVCKAAVRLEQHLVWPHLFFKLLRWVYCNVKVNHCCLVLIVNALVLKSKQTHRVLQLLPPLN